MEIFGILLAMPVGLVVSGVYTLVTAGWLERNRKHTWALFPITTLVLLLAFVEANVLMRLGAYQADRRLGVWFHLLHLLVLVLGAPAVANATLMLLERMRVRKHIRIGVAILLCFLAGMTLLFGNIIVYEDTYGVDGSGVRPDSDVGTAKGFSTILASEGRSAAGAYEATALAPGSGEQGVSTP